MATTLEKEWAAVKGEEILVKADTKGELRHKINSGDFDEEDYEIVALPMSHNSMFV